MPVLLSVVMILGIQIGRMISYSNSKPSFFSQPANNTFDEVLNFIEAKFVDTVNVDELKNKAIEQLILQLDPHSSFIPASDLKGVNEMLDGNFEGIGIEFFTLKDTVTAISIVSGGPAEKAGIMVGDKLIKVNDTLIAGVGISDNEVMKKLRGHSGSKVKVTIKRNANNKLIDVTIVRGKIPLNSIDAFYMINSTSGYIKINRFSSTTYTEFVSAITNLKKNGMKSLIIDLRGNGGGFLDAACDVIDELLEQQKLMVYTKGRVYPRKDYNSRVLGNFEQGNVAILIDEGSASASEIVAGAIQDWDRGIIVGRRSYGKGFVESQLPLSDGSALRLTIAKYYTPSGRCIQKPYGHDVHAYYDEIYHRFEDGELMSKDSFRITDSTKYFTSNGKTVYGGGGIIPDLFVPLDTTMIHNNYIKAILDNNLIPPFVYNYCNSEKSKFKAYKSVNDFMADQSFQNNLLAAFKLTLQNLSGIAGSNSTKSDQYILLQLKAYTAKQLFGDAGYYQVLNSQDKTVLAALQALK